MILLIIILVFIGIYFYRKENFNPENNNILTLEEYCAEFIEFAEKIKVNNPEVKFDKYMYLLDYEEKLDFCKRDVIKTFKIKDSNLPITNPLAIYTYKCMKDNDNWKDYRDCFTNIFENIFTE